MAKKPLQDLAAFSQPWTCAGYQARATRPRNGQIPPVFAPGLVSASADNQEVEICLHAWRSPGFSLLRTAFACARSVSWAGVGVEMIRGVGANEAYGGFPGQPDPARLDQPAVPVPTPAAFCFVTGILRFWLHCRAFSGHCKTVAVEGSRG